MMKESSEDWAESATVLSEVHMGCNACSSFRTSVFYITLPGSQHAEGIALQKKNGDEDQSKQEVSTSQVIDENGDLVINRRKRMRSVECSCNKIIVHHRMATTIPCVGLQVWKGALLLADFILHKIRTSCEFDNIKAMELGAGTGIPAITLSRASNFVIITDRDPDVLDNCYRNVLVNSHTFRYGETAARVRKLDWQDSWPPDDTSCQNEELVSSYSWSKQDVQDVAAVQVLLAADVIYSNERTDLFFKMLNHLMPPNSSKALYLSLEKRYNFTLDDLNVVAHGYEYFRSFFHLKTSRPSLDELRLSKEQQHPERADLMGEQICIDSLPQYISNYERGNSLELWKIYRKDSTL